MLHVANHWLDGATPLEPVPFAGLHAALVTVCQVNWGRGSGVGPTHVPVTMRI